MSQKFPSRKSSFTPTCPENPDENDENRRTISQIQQEVERELEHADRILSGSRANSRTESTRFRSDSARKDVNADTDATDGYRSSVTPTSKSNVRGSRSGECSRMSQGETLFTNREAGYDSQNSNYEAGGPHGQYSLHESTVASASPSLPRAGDPYDGSGRAGSSYGGPGRPGDSYDGSGRGGNGYDEPVRSSDPHESFGRAASGYGGPGRSSDTYDGSNRGGNGYDEPVRSSDPHESFGRAASGYGGPGRSSDPYDGSNRGGNGYDEPVRSSDPHESFGRAASGYGGPGRSSDPYDGPNRGGNGYDEPVRSSDPHESFGRAASGYGGPGRSGDPYGVTSSGGVGHDPLEAYLEAADPNAASKGSESPACAVRSRDPSKINYDQGRNALGITFNATSPAAYESRGKSPPSVHYSPSTASRVGSPPRMQSSKPASETMSNIAGGISPTKTQYSASRAQSQADFILSNTSGYERSTSPIRALNPSSKHTSDLIGTALEVTGFERPGNYPSIANGSRVSPNRSIRAGSPTDGSKGTFGSGRKDQPPMNNRICPAALNGKCPAFARDSNITEQGRATTASYSSANKRPLSRIEEGPSREEMGGNEVQGQRSRTQGEDFRHPAGVSCSPLQAAKEVYTSCPTRLAARPRCKSPGQPMYDCMINDQFQGMAPRPQPISFGQPPTQNRVSASPHEHYHHDHHDHDMEGFQGKPVHQRDEKAISALNHLSQLRKTPSYYRCKLNSELDLSSCEKTTKEAPKMVKFPEKPCKAIEELQEMISCETQDVESAWYLTSDEKKTYKKPCPKQQKAQENVKSIVKAQTPQPCSKEYTPLDHPDPDDITPELAASMMFSQERGIKLNECPDETIKLFFPDIPRPPFPVKLNGVHIVDPNQEDQEEMIEKSASVPSEGVSDSAYTRTMQNKGDMGAQKSYDIDFAIGAEKREYVLVAEKPQRYNKVQFRGNLPSWFPGYMQAFPSDKNGLQVVGSPSELFQKAWTNTNPENIPSTDVVVLE